MFDPILCFFSRGRPGPSVRVLSLLVVFFAAATFTRAAYEGPVPPPADAFGSSGPYTVSTQTFPSPGWPEQVVTVYLPNGAPGRRPVWFFAHGFAGVSPVLYGELLTHLASHGAVVVFSPYPADLRPANDYPIIFDGFAAAVERFADRIDLTHAGFAGHSFGAGAVPSLALRGVRERGWGSAGLALLLLAPWYCYSFTEADFAAFPAGTQAVVQVYEDDTINDHRMAVDIFNHLALPPADKDYLLVRSDRISGYNFRADHNVPTGAANPRGGVFNACDAWGVLRLAQALAASAWDNDPAARAVALGHGSVEQVSMGVAAGARPLRPMVETAAPMPLFPSSRYAQKWDSVLNPRRAVPLPVSPSRPHLSNLSARARSTSGADVLIVGATLLGSRPASLLVRAIGPGLTRFGVGGAMADPRLLIYRGSAIDVDLDNWADAITPDALEAATEETGAFTLAANSRDAAVLASFPPGAMTAQSVPSDGVAGVTLLELYQADLDPSAPLVNLSARARLESDDESGLTAGFVVAGGDGVRLLIRGIGPALTALGVTDALGDPRLEIYRGNDRLADNDAWSADPRQASDIAAAARSVGAFPLFSGSADTAVLLTLPAGAYTARVRSRAGRSGIALVELYVVP